MSRPPRQSNKEHVRTLVFACVAVTAVALAPAPVLRASGGHLRRARLPSAGWVTANDDTSGSLFYFNEHTGESQWFPPQGYGAQVVWRVVPGSGVDPLTEHTIRNGEEQVLGRWDMLQQSVYISRMQCIVQVAADGTATLVSTGKPPTAVRLPNDASWYNIWLSNGERKTLVNGEQIALDCKNPDGAFYTIWCEETAYMGSDGQYSDDGNWMWTGAEWVSAR